MKNVFTILSIWLLALGVDAQSIWNNPITDSNPSSANPFTSGDVVAANLSVSGIGRGTGLSANAGSNRYNATSWTTGGSIDVNDYFYWTLTPAGGYEIDFVSLSFTTQSSNTGPNTYILRSSVDNYTANIATISITPNGSASALQTVNLSAGTFQNIGSAITFRMYGYGGSGATGTNSINDFTFNGTVSSTGCTAPSTQASGINFSAVGQTALDVNWTNGNGAGRVVLMNTTNTFTAPVNGSNPTANTTYAGSGQQVIYNGTGTGPVTVTGLTPGATYWFRVYEYCSPSRSYQTATASSNPNSTITLPPNSISTDRKSVV